MKEMYLSFFLAFLFFCLSEAQSGNGISCEEAVCLSENLGRSLNNNHIPFDPMNFSCGTFYRGMHYAFCPDSNKITFNITNICEGHSGVQVVICETDDCINFIEDLCLNLESIDSIDFDFYGIPGRNYIMIIDGIVFDNCNLEISATGITNYSNIPPSPEFNFQDSILTICQGEELEIEITNADHGCFLSFWKILSGNRNIRLSENSNKAIIQGVSQGEAQVCVVMDNFCSESESCFVVEVVAKPSLEPIQDVISCDRFVDFCNIYSGFFDPELNPDPRINGWDISFYSTFHDAHMQLNPIICPYDLNGRSIHSIYYRLQAGNYCDEIGYFKIFHDVSLINEILLDPFCAGPIDLSQVIESKLINGFQIDTVIFYDNEWNAFRDTLSLEGSVVSMSGNYCVRVQINGCFDVECFDVTVVPFPEIKVEDPPILCWSDEIEFNLDSLRITELTGFYDLEDLDVRWYRDLPEDDADFEIFINNPRAIVNDTGLYYVRALVSTNNRNQMYCPSPIVEINLQAEQPIVDNQEVYFLCENEEMNLSQNIGNNDVNGLVYRRNAFFRSEEDAKNDVNEIIPPIVNGSNTYWQKVETENGCVSIDSFEILESSAAKIDNWDMEFSEWEGIITLQLAVNGTDSPFYYQWSDGYIGDQRTRLNYGEHYDLTVTNAFGCDVIRRIYVRYSSSLEGCSHVTLSPSVLSRSGTILVSDEIQLYSYQVINFFGEPATPRLVAFDNMIEVPDLGMGTYYVFLYHSEGICLKKFVITT